MCTMSSSKPPPLPARGNLPPLHRINRSVSAIGRPLPAVPQNDSAPISQNPTSKANTMPIRNSNIRVPSQSNYVNHEPAFLKKTPKAETQLTHLDVPGLPPRRPSVSNEEQMSPTGLVPPRSDSCAPPSLPSRGPALRTSMSSNQRTPPTADLEVRFPFHPERDFPPPEPFSQKPNKRSTPRTKSELPSV